MTPALLAVVASELEGTVGASTSTNANDPGYWKRIAAALEVACGSTFSANASEQGYAYRALQAANLLAGTSYTSNGSEEGYLRGIASALGTVSGTAFSGSWSNYLVQAATAYTYYVPQAQFAFNAMTVQPDATRKALIAAFISGLISDGVWARKDWLSLTAAHDAQAARLNLKNPVQAMTAVNSPTFTTDRGYTGDGATSYLNTGWSPTLNAVTFAQDDMSLGVWCGTDVALSTKFDVGNTRARINARTTGTTVRGYVNSSTVSDMVLGVGTSVGHAVYTRTGAAVGAAYKNGVNLGALATTSAAMQDMLFLVGAYNNVIGTTPSPLNHSNRRIQAVHWGQSLSDAQTLALYNRLATYMTAIGA